MLDLTRSRNLPFQNSVQSPIGLVPKANDKTCLIFHLSFDFREDESEKSIKLPYAKKSLYSEI